MLAAFPIACMNSAEDGESYFSLEAAPSLTGYRRVTVQLSDTLGNLKATLYDDSLPSVSRLGRLPAGPYRGGYARITILAYRGNALAYREIRVYDGTSQKVLSVEILTEGNIAIDTVPVAVKLVRRGPTFALVPGDTVVSIRDSVPMPAEALDQDGDLAGYAWDCDGDGRPEDSAALDGFRAKIRFGKVFADSGARTCRLRVWDREGRAIQADVKIRVLQDVPAGDAGRDTTVLVETRINLHAMGEDGFGPIVTREWKIGSQEFKHMTQQETSIMAPATPGDLMCILRVTDSDGLIGLDTMVVNVVYNPDNTLSDLKINVGALEPGFRKDVRDYLVKLSPADSVLMIFPKVNESHATATVQGMDIEASHSGSVPIRDGDNYFTVRVTAQDGSTLQYFVTARR